MKKILCIAGPSGSGKSMMASYIERTHGIPHLRNYTDRPRRGRWDREYGFVSPEEMDGLLQGDVLTDTLFGGHRYCCLERDLGDRNVHVLDERGIDQLLDNFKNRYDIKTVYVEADEEIRKTRVGGHRLERDEGKFHKKLSDYDYVVLNDASKEETFQQIDGILAKENYITRP